MSDSPLPCGLYRTTQPLAAHGEAVGANRLVYFHNHSQKGVPMVQLPKSNRNNRWTFEDSGFSILDPSYPTTLVGLKREGLWRLREHFHPDEERVVDANSLVQLGYNRAAEPIVFFPLELDDANGFAFPNSGTKITAAIYELLEPIAARGPRTPRKIH